jgi:hypothetical protein
LIFWKHAVVVTTSERLGRAMMRVAQGRAGRFILESPTLTGLQRDANRHVVP